MTFAGLSTGALLATLGAVGAALVALYLLKERRREVIVPHVALWEQLLAERRSATWWKRLRQIASLLLALLIASLIALALGDPRPRSPAEASHTVLLIDASMSMQAQDVPGGRLGQAKALARRFVQRLGDGDRALIAQLDVGVTPLTPMTQSRAELLSGVDRVRATDLRGRLDAGLAFARDVLRGRTGPRVVVVSDGQLAGAGGADDLPVRYLRVGTGGANAGITAFSVRRYPLDKSHSEVLVAVRNYSERETAVTLRLSAEDTLLHEQRLELPPKGTVRRVLADLPGAERPLTARIVPAERGAPDKLPADDVAYAQLPPRRRLRVLSVSPGNRYLEAALLLDEALEVDEAPPGAEASAAGYDVVIYDGWLPASPPEAPALYLHPTPRPGGVAPLQTKGALTRPFIDRLDRKHPLLRYVALRDVNIGSALKLKPEPGDQVVAATAAREPLIVAGRRQAHPFVALAFDVRESDLPLRVAWPVLLLNAIEHLAGGDPDYISSFRAGRLWRMVVPDGTTRATIELPGGERREVLARGGEVVFSGARAGLYALQAGGERRWFAVQGASPDEGELTPAPRLRGTPPAAPPPPGGAGGRRHLWPWLLAAALALLGVEWLTFHRRWTV